MKKLLKAFKSLPPEMKMLVAMAGLGTPAGAIWMLRRFFPGVPLFLLILCVAAVVGGVLLLIFLISAVFKRGRKKRTSRMAADLADETQAGPQSIDVSAAIKANNEKFFTAVRDMRKNIGISVYDLPWYIIIGDSGCGKTKLINEGGLTFSTGKPEGYQLGTLNYNWWFTEDAIFVDMAGRLCNPQDDSDRREWSAFLDTVAKGRKGFPINGALVCVSADHLLQDPPEKIEADANTTLERLRDLQTKLGVTFATYLVITKCDKILGFMQFFDRAERDITVKNQIFGWSKPGEFNELYDPEKFAGDFDSVYGRLNELRLRRLNDEAEEIDLGLAYSFPEEFRSLYEPTQIYLRTIFPFIRNPRAVKNLIFRGVYFTSATQEGELILKHLTERLGQEAADQFPPLDDLYPNKRPHFIKDLLFRKVFPERGLVFRNEQQVVRNKKLNRVLKVGTLVLTALLLTGFIWSFRTISSLMIEPRQHAEDLAAEFRDMTPQAALGWADRLSKDVDHLEAHTMAAVFLSVGLGTGKPVNELERLRASLVEKAVVQALTEVDGVLRSGAGLDQPGTEPADAYMAAAEQYLAWFGCREETERREAVTPGDFDKLTGVLGSRPGSIAGQARFGIHTRWYFETIGADSRLGRNPAVLLTRSGFSPEETVERILDHLYGYFVDNYATLSEQHADKNVRRWIRIRNACATVDGTYRDMLGSAKLTGQVSTLDQFVDLREQFLGRYDSLREGVDRLSWQAEDTDARGVPSIPMLADVVWQQRERWVEYIERLSDAADRCNAADAEVTADIEALGKGGRSRKGADRELWESLVSLGLAKGSYDPAVFEEAVFKRRIAKVEDVYSNIVELVPGDEQSGNRLQAKEAVLRVKEDLESIRDRLASVDTGIPAPPVAAEVPERWIEQLKAFIGTPRDHGPIRAADSPAFWEPGKLQSLSENVNQLVSQGGVTVTLLTMFRHLTWAADDKWGFARLQPHAELAAEEAAPFTIEPPPAPAGTAVAGETTAGQVPQPEVVEADVDLFAGPDQLPDADATTFDESTRPRRHGQGRVAGWAKHDFMRERAKECIALLYYLRRLGTYLRDDVTEARPLHERSIEQLRKAARRYMNAYVEGWGTAYRDGTLHELAELTDGSSSWSTLARNLAHPSTRVRIVGEIEESLTWILRSTSFATYDATKRVWWEGYPQVRQEGADVAEWFWRSLDEKWDPDLGAFVSTPRLRDVPDLREPPWVRLAQEFAGRWREVAKGIGNRRALPRRFDDSTVGESAVLPGIPWGELQELRTQYGLEDERFTQQLKEFESWAQRLLSAELSGLLERIQQAHFASEDPKPGWPYLPGEKLETVNFAEFLEFLREVHRAEELLRELEGGIPYGTVGCEERRAFYRACKAWRRFLQLPDDADAYPDDLRLSIRGYDPREPPFTEMVEGCSTPADWVVLDFGAGPGAVRTACESDQQKLREVTWSWTAQRGREVQLRLDALSPRVSQVPPPKILGEYSPLALCAYLERKGIAGRDRQSWYVTETFDVWWRAEASEAEELTVGQKLRFELPRPLPEPILKLRTVPTAGTADR